jgi:EAL domain-containing protein (putative c-di-GMP-specific phosphodiesterase class I)
VIYDPAVYLRTTPKAVERSGLHPKQIIFKVVESHAVGDTALLRSTLDQYREWGFLVALDDVDAGHSGLTMLANLEPDLIKIDREFVAASTHSNAHKQIFQSLVAIGHRQGKLVLAEGVETHDEYMVAKALGADLVQGYPFGKPQPEPVIEALIASI